MGALDPRVWLALIVGFLATTTGAYFYGMHSANAANEAKANKAIIAYIPKVQAKEAETNSGIQGAEHETEAKLAALSSKYDAAVVELGRLRVKRPACNVSNSSASTGTRDAPSAATERSDGPGTSEIDLDDVAKEVVRLGNDFDGANLRIDELRSLVRVYEKACKVN